eukprot:6469938-Amphidinium_carterae.2
MWALPQHTSSIYPFVVSLCDGVGCAFIALQSMGIRFAGLSAEIDEELRNHVRGKWPHVSSWSDMTTLSTETVLQQFRRSGCTSILLIAGAPCQPFSSLGNQHGFDDPRSQPLTHFFHMRDELQTACRKLDTPFHWLLEEVATMKEDARQRITALAGVPPVLIQAADFGWVHRSRLLGSGARATQTSSKGHLS